MDRFSLVAGISVVVFEDWCYSDIKCGFYTTCEIDMECGVETK